MRYYIILKYFPLLYFFSYFIRSSPYLDINVIFSVILVRKFEEKATDGTIKKTDDLLDCAPLEESENYNLEEEDPSIYTDEEDADRFCPRREWPDRALPKKSSVGPSPSSSALENKELTDYLLKAHHMHVDVLQQFGIDACEDYRASKAKNVLAKLSAEGAKKCTICGITVYDTQKLRKHIQLKHMGKTSHKCVRCGKYFSDSVTLKTHSKKHAQEGYDKICDTCGKAYPTTGKLNEHKQSHEGGKFACRYCAKVFNHKRNKDDHEKSCKKGPPDVIKANRVKCVLCGKDYAHKRDLKCHMNTDHE